LFPAGGRLFPLEARAFDVFRGIPEKTNREAWISEYNISSSLSLYATEVFIRAGGAKPTSKRATSTTLFDRRSIIIGFVIREYVWNLTQSALGAPEFKAKLYRSVLHPPGRLLDFGCATGHLAGAFLEFEYYGVDIEPDVIEAARATFKMHPNAHFVAADIRLRPFAENYFDEVLFAGTAHHVDDSLLPAILKELHFCLKPGAMIHLFDPVLQTKDNWQQKLMRRIDRGNWPRRCEEILGLIEPLGIFEIGEPSFHPPYGAVIQDCDFLYLPLRKRLS